LKFRKPVVFQGMTISDIPWKILLEAKAYCKFAERGISVGFGIYMNLKIYHIGILK